MTSKTGQFTLKVEDIVHEYALNEHKKLAKIHISSKIKIELFETLSDNRAYYVKMYEPEWVSHLQPDGRYLSQYVQIYDVFLMDPKQAEIDEYVFLGTLDTLMPNAGSYIYLSEMFLFQRDTYGWKRVQVDKQELRTEYENYLRDGEWDEDKTRVDNKS